MRALVRDDSGITLDTRRTPPTAAMLEPGAALIRISKAAIGSADLVAAGRDSTFRGVLGHQFIGTVEAVNGAPSRLIGARVVGSNIIACGTCDMCRGGLGAHCRTATRAGLHRRDGCLATVMALPAANLTPVPDEVDDDHAVFAHELGAAIHMARQLTIAGKPFVTVLGHGSLALVSAQVMARMNASVRVIGASMSNLALCEKWNVKHRAATEIGRRADQDVVVNCDAAGAGLDLAFDLVRPRGKIITRSPRPADAGELSRLVDREITLIGSCGTALGEAVEMLRRLDVDVLSLIDRRMRLEDAAKIFDIAARPEALTIIVDVAG